MAARITKHLLDKSEEKTDFSKASREWEEASGESKDRPPPVSPDYSSQIEGIPDTKEVKSSAGVCLCGQPFKKGIHLKNSKNGNEIYVGTTCLRIIKSGLPTKQSWWGSSSWDDEKEESTSWETDDKKEEGSGCIVM